MHLPDDAQIGDLIAKGCVFALVCGFAFTLLIVLPLAMFPIMVAAFAWALLKARQKGLFGDG